MNKIPYDKQALLQELKKAAEASKPQSGIDITVADIQELMGISYNKALNFLNEMTNVGILRKVKLPSHLVVYRDDDGKAMEKISNYIKSLN